MSIITTAFADNCKEELLTFDKDGMLESRKAAVIDHQRENQSNLDEAYSYSMARSVDQSQY
jgi:hypothetical protein